LKSGIRLAGSGSWTGRYRSTDEGRVGKQKTAKILADGKKQKGQHSRRQIHYVGI